MFLFSLLLVNTERKEKDSFFSLSDTEEESEKETLLLRALN